MPQTPRTGKPTQKNSKTKPGENAHANFDGAFSMLRAIGTGRERGAGKEGQQNEIHMPGVRTERMGQAGYAVNLRRVLRGQRRRNLPHAGRAKPGELAEAASQIPPPCQITEARHVAERVSIKATSHVCILRQQ
jgi:hypothetical protein